MLDLEAASHIVRPKYENINYKEERKNSINENNYNRMYKCK